MRKTRADYTMVPEDDPRWAAFWNKYPRRVSKKDARRAWARLNPTPELMALMFSALDWQIPLWERDNFTYAPYPASWLNGERWTDDPPKPHRGGGGGGGPQAGHAAMSVLETLLGDGTNG